MIHESPTDPVIGLGFRGPLFPLPLPSLLRETYENDKAKATAALTSTYSYQPPPASSPAQVTGGASHLRDPSVVDQPTAGLGRAVVILHKGIAVAGEEG